jgi:O-succinylbenzoic acid--CoA ligase
MPIQISAQWSIPQAIAALSDAQSISVSTSGSTGVAKTITISRSALKASAQASNQITDAHTGDTWSLLLPLSHVAGINVIARAIELGTTPIDCRPGNSYSNVDFTAVVPTHIHRALNGDSALLNHLKSAKKVLVGGAPLSSLDRTAAESAGITIIATYGMTETCGGCVYDGIPVPGVDYKIEDGIIYLRGPMLADVDLVDGWFKTSDRGHIENGRLVIDGRIDDQIISGGEKISLSTIENALKEKFNSDFAAFAKGDAEWGQRLCIAKVKEIADSEITTYLKECFGSHVSPKEIVRVPSIPTTGIGKPDRKKLAEG